MKRDSVSDMKVYQNAKKVSKTLGITNNNLKRYTQILQAADYKFTEDEGKVNYFEKDIIVLKKLMELVNIEGISPDEAAKDVIAMFENGQEEVNITSKDTITLENSTTQEEVILDTSECDTIEKKLDKAIQFIMDQKRIEAEFTRIVKEKEEIIKNLKAEVEQLKRDKQVINLRDKLLLETIRRRQQEQKNAVDIGFWPRKKAKK